MDMTTELYRNIRADATPLTIVVDGKTYATEKLTLVEEQEKMRSIPRCKTVGSLDAFVALIQREAVTLYHGKNLFVEVDRFNRVVCFTDVFTEHLSRYERQELYVAESTDAPGWEDKFMDYESAVIALRSRFVPNEGTEYLLGLLSRISDNAEVQTNDNGMTQVTTINQGIALLGKEAIRPIVPLQPYRTFQEVAQPESEFLVRVKKVRDENMIGLLEADGGMWKLKCRKIIRDYLEEALKPSENDRIVLTL